MAMMNGNRGEMKVSMGKQPMDMSMEESSNADPMVVGLSEVKTMLEEILTSQDISKIQDVIDKITELETSRQESDILPKDEYMKMTPDEKDKMDEQEVMRK